MLIPSTGKYIIDDVIKNNNVGLLSNIMFIIILSIIVQAITFFILVHVLGIKAQKEIATIRTQFFNKITHLPLSYFKNSSSGEITSRILGDFDSLRILFGFGLVQLIGGILSVCLALLLMTILNLKLTLLIIVPIIIFSIILYLIYKKQKPAFKNKKAVRANVSSSITEAFRGIKIIKGFASNDYSTNIIKKDFFQLFAAIKQTLISANLIISSGTFFIGLTSLLLMWFGSHMVINNELTIGEFTTFTMYLAFLIAPVIQITRVSSQFTDANASIDRINETFELENEKNNSSEPNFKITGAVKFENVAFSYGSIAILKSLTFNIQPKSVNAFVGKSGSGKTTITELIAAFHTPKSGSIFIDEKPISSINLNNYRQQLGFVFQETYLFNGTIKENILLAKPKASEDEISIAIKNANVTEFLSELKDGINTIVGEDGSKLSAGQKQRIAIARAFLANPTILILDEATSNLDAHNEKLINESIAELMKNRTIIIIAHRLNTIKNADQIFLIDNGEISEQGKHDELMAKNGQYFNLYNNFNNHSN
jgi:ATP-binding cassette, subfamily B, putative efflux pump